MSVISAISKYFRTDNLFFSILFPFENFMQCLKKILFFSLFSHYSSQIHTLSNHLLSMLVIYFFNTLQSRFVLPTYSWGGILLGAEWHFLLEHQRPLENSDVYIMIHNGGKITLRIVNENNFMVEDHYNMRKWSQH